ncbi:MAG: hypothetical protein EOP50_19720 [Sphingobacteriales bacterium]|nr:MAG: hypothetical protein EOP50_19720 [Sphingobacteriales bacterium]
MKNAISSAVECLSDGKTPDITIARFQQFGPAISGDVPSSAITSGGKQRVKSAVHRPPPISLLAGSLIWQLAERLFVHVFTASIFFATSSQRNSILKFAAATADEATKDRAIEKNVVTGRIRIL